MAATPGAAAGRPGDVPRDVVQDDDLRGLPSSASTADHDGMPHETSPVEDNTGSDAGVITRYAEAWRAGDLEALVACYADDIVAHYGGRSRFAGTHRGRDRLLEVLVTTAALGDRRLVSIDQIDDNGHSGALFVTESFTVDGDTVAVPRCLRYRVVNDRLAECWLFEHEQHLVEQAWGAAPGAGS